MLCFKRNHKKCVCKLDKVEHVRKNGVLEGLVKKRPLLAYLPYIVSTSSHIEQKFPGEMGDARVAQT